MRKNPRRILSPQRLPFRHPGAGTTNLANPESYCNTASSVADCSKCPVSVVVSVGLACRTFNRSTAASLWGARQE